MPSDNKHVVIGRFDVMIDDQQEGSDKEIIELNNSVKNIVIFTSYCINYSSHHSRNCTGIKILRSAQSTYMLLQVCTLIINTVLLRKYRYQHKKIAVILLY